MAVLYVHIGTQKTGTTAIQQLLSHSREALAKQGAVYPDFNLRFSGFSRDVNASWLTVSGYNEETAAACFEKINSLADNFQTIILSDEVLWNSTAYQKKFWRNLRSHLRDEIEIRMLVYVRRQDEYAYSYWAQQIKAQKQYAFDTGTFLDFVYGDSFSRVSDHMDYQKYIQNVADVIGKENIVLRVYERGQFLNGDLYADFFDAVSLTLNEDFVIPKRLKNISLKGNVLETKRYLNRIPEFSEKEYRLLPYLEKVQERMEADGSLRIRNDFPQEERLKLMQRYEASNEWVARNILCRQDGVLFRDPVPEDREAASGYETGEVTDVCGYIMLHMMDSMRSEQTAAEQLKRIRSSRTYRISEAIAKPVRKIRKRMHR